MARLTGSSSEQRSAASELVSKAQGVLVFPSVKKAAFVVGAEHGEGALRVGGATVGYYNTTSASFGLQAGVQSTVVIFLFMTQSALDGFRNSAGWSAGADTGVSIAKVGANGAIDTTSATSQVVALVLTNVVPHSFEPLHSGRRDTMRSTFVS